MFFRFLGAEFNRMELFYKDCPVYESTIPEKTALVFTYNPLFIYLFVAFEALYQDRTVFHWLLYTGFGLTSIGVMLTNLYLPLDSIKEVVCSQAGVEPCEGASIVVYIAIFFFFYHVNHSERSWMYTGGVFAVLLFMTASTLMSYIGLELYSAEEVGLGAVIGAFIATVMSMIGVCFMEPRFNKGTLGSFTSFARLDPSRYK